jgi:hypothetical protein
MDFSGFMSNVGKVAHETTSALGSAQRGATWAGPYVHSGGTQHQSHHEGSHLPPHHGRRGRSGKRY